jgi:hypothetical protein
MKRALFVGVSLLVASAAFAQFRGMGRIGGTVVDDGGSPLSGVVITAKLPGTTGVIDSKSDDKGAWFVGGMGKGDWEVTFEKAGFAPRHAKVVLPVELARVPPIAVTMKKGS